MKTKEIVKLIEREGIKIEGKTEPKRLVSAALIRRNDLFVRVNRGVYDLISKKKEL